MVKKSKNMRPDILSRNVGKHLRTLYNIPGEEDEGLDNTWAKATI